MEAISQDLLQLQLPTDNLRLSLWLGEIRPSRISYTDDDTVKVA